MDRVQKTHNPKLIYEVPLSEPFGHELNYGIFGCNKLDGVMSRKTVILLCYFRCAPRIVVICSGRTTAQDYSTFKCCIPHFYFLFVFYFTALSVARLHSFQ
jgi:hypothetical protein